jgi:predicted DNA-binding transcriptional regulator AlpA
LILPKKVLDRPKNLGALLEIDTSYNTKPPSSEANPWLQDQTVPSLPSETPSHLRNGLTSRSPNTIEFPAHEAVQERLLNAREVAARLGVSERWVRDHTTRRSPRIRAVKLGTLIRYRRIDIEMFMESVDTFHSSRQPRFGV